MNEPPLVPGNLPEGWYELKINPGVDEHHPVFISGKLLAVVTRSFTSFRTNCPLIPRAAKTPQMARTQIRVVNKLSTSLRSFSNSAFEIGIDTKA